MPRHDTVEATPGLLREMASAKRDYERELAGFLACSLPWRALLTLLGRKPDDPVPGFSSGELLKLARKVARKGV